MACQNCAVYSVFPSGMTSHSKIAQFNLECIGRFWNKTERKKEYISVSLQWNADRNRFKRSISKPSDLWLNLKLWEIFMFC